MMRSVLRFVVSPQRLDGILHQCWSGMTALSQANSLAKCG
jgi:hypothetical protein